ncbi:MAG: UDP-4-amino-4,6-dideoxy-N-acetyl-beta-L-altrosamine N-acetyltransferase [Cyclobacteriaceae bacterium]
MNDIQLVKLVEDDLEIVRGWRNSKEVSDYMYTDSYISEVDQKQWYQKIDWTRSVYWVINYQEKQLGLASITSIDKTLKSCYWAFYLADSSVRGAGIGAKVEYNVIEYVFGIVGLNKLRCEVFAFNDKVIQMHEKFGFRREGYYREHCIKGNAKLDVVGLALLKSEWEALREKIRLKIYG